MNTRIVFDSPIKIVDGNDFNRYNCVPTLKTFKHKDYCCPFCSHGETIQLKVLDIHKGNIIGMHRRAYLECSENCMAYGIFERSYLHGYTEEEKISSIIEKALDAFEKMIIFSRDRTEFVMV
jgi:hypothetical protein